MQVSKVAVIGGGLMGYGIAQIVATSGQEVRLIDISDAILQKASERIKDSLDKLERKGVLREPAGGILKRIRPLTSMAEGVAGVDLVIEAVSEDIELKKKIFAQLDALAPKQTILATNTSGLSVDLIAQATKRTDRVIGMHWMNPPQIMKLVEIIKSKNTSDETEKTIVELCKLYGKETIVARRDVWFFLAARARTGWSVECIMTYLRKEAGIKEIDALGRYRVGVPMGEFEYSDFTGASEIRARGLASVEKILALNPQFEPWDAYLSVNRYLVREFWDGIVKKGLTGVKTGKGFYEYPEAKYVKPDIPKDLAAGIEPIQLLAPAVNVAAWCVTNGVGSIGDTNKAFRLAFGWPKGIFEFVDEYGSDKMVAVLQDKEKKAPDWLRGLYHADNLLVNWSKLKNSA